MAKKRQSQRYPARTLRDRRVTASVKLHCGNGRSSNGGCGPTPAARLPSFGDLQRADLAMHRSLTVYLNRIEAHVTQHPWAVYSVACPASN
jgi:hypothetical protein